MDLHAVGIIVEYNPFHKGHLWHINQARLLSGREYVVAVMSGHFVQRGEPAIFDKWLRAEMAIGGGVDVVIELPVVFAVRSAENFAAGAVRLLASLGIVDHICFGAENPALDVLSTLAASLDNKTTVDTLKKGLASGLTYAAALGAALANHTEIDPAIIQEPNNILGIEYLRAIRKYAPQLQALPIPRKHAGFHDSTIEHEIASATALRSALLEPGDSDSLINSALPSHCATVISRSYQEGRSPMTFNHLEQLLLGQLRLLSLEQLSQLPEVSEGLQHRIKEYALTCHDLR